MTIPVLKNRLLQLTDRKFRATDHGARNFREFLRNISDLVDVSDTTTPGHVTLRSAASIDLPIDESKIPIREIRADLWDAVLDFSSSDRYIWDTINRRARVALEGENELQLPTLTADEFDRWRTDFITEQHLVDEPVLKQLEHWRDTRLPTLALPPAYRGLWNKFLKERVKRRLSEWFASEQLGDIPVLPSLQRAPADDDLKNLRDFVIRCVQEMSTAELEQLRISPTIVLRVLKK